MTGPIDDRTPAAEAAAEGRHREDRAPATPTRTSCSRAAATSAAACEKT